MSGINWPELWAEFNKWCDDETEPHQGFPDWFKEQQPKIQELVEKALSPILSPLQGS